ncbi:MAG: metallophosphoesterase [Elusimicrobiota bacterium]
MKRHIQPLINRGLLNLSIPDKPQSSKQKYKTTEKGLAFSCFLMYYLLENPHSKRSDMIVVGDLHGELDKLVKILKEFKDERFLFIGDYCDSFTATDQEIIDTLSLVMESKGIILSGNHELNYFNSWGFNGYCSGYRSSLQNRIVSPLIANQNKFKIVHYEIETNILYSHAGISLQWLKSTCPDIKETQNQFDYIKQLELLNPFALSENHPVFAIGAARGGNSICGGPLWCDWYNDYEPLPWIRQIFGHTPIEKISTTYYKNKINSWNIDCLLYRNEVLEVCSTKRVKVRKF